MELIGTWQRPENIAADRVGTIHDDNAAKALGFDGGWVSARVHLNVFVALLVGAFGREWFERGTLSLDFKQATLDRAKVRAVMQRPSPGHRHTPIRLEDGDGAIIASGTASVGDSTEPTYLGTKNLSRRDGGPYVLVGAVIPGDTFAPREIVLKETVARRMVGGVPFEDWYTRPSPWGPPVASPSLMVNALSAACVAYLREHPIDGVFIDGGTELRNVNGPVLLDTVYTCGGEILARGRSPRTEYFWFNGWLDNTDGNRVAEMLLQWRCMPTPSS